MTSKHTPGPWHTTVKYEVGPRSNAEDQSYGMVVPVADVFGDNKAYDARLIAAAPEMYEALKEVNALILAPAEDLKQSVLDRVRAAIAKAEGRTS
jgi:hypothetical protein